MSLPDESEESLPSFVFRIRSGEGSGTPSVPGAEPSIRLFRSLVGMLRSESRLVLECRSVELDAEAVEFEAALGGVDGEDCFGESGVFDLVSVSDERFGRSERFI